jgi:hypothetical protein
MVIIFIYWRPSKIQILRKYGSLMHIDTIYIEMKIHPPFYSANIFSCNVFIFRLNPLPPLPTGQAGFSKGELGGW